MAVFSGNGSAASPSFTFSSDTNTGIYRVGADQLGFATAGANVGVFTSGGDFGVGIDSPAARIHAFKTSDTQTTLFTAASNNVANTTQTRFDVKVTSSGSVLLTTQGLGTAAGVDQLVFGTASTGVARFDGGNRFLYGVSTARNKFYNTDVTPAFQVESTSEPRLSVVSSNSLDGFSGQLIIGHQQSGTAGGNGAVNSNSSLGLVSFQGSDGTELVEAARIEVIANATTGANDMPGAMLFQTTADGAAGSTERMRIDRSGKVLIGATASATGGNGVDSSLQIRGNTSGSGFEGKILLMTGTATGSVTATQGLGRIIFGNGDGEGAYIDGFADAQWGNNDYPGRITFSTTPDGSGVPVERMRIINDGQVSIGTTSTNPIGDQVNGSRFASSGYNVYRTAAGGETIAVGRAGDGNAISFYRNGATAVGSITVSAGATAFNTSSDYRLKENLVEVTDGIERLQQLKPVRFNFIGAPDRTVDGFLAHEVQNVVPEAITGEKDGVDEDGAPVYQGIDQSKLVPLLTAALQEAVAKIESLETRVAALGG